MGESRTQISDFIIISHNKLGKSIEPISSKNKICNLLRKGLQT